VSALSVGVDNMTSPWTYALILMAAIALMCSVRVPRAWRWIGLGGASFFASTLFLDYGPWPEWHPLFTFGCDAAVCFIAFLCSTLSSLLRMGGFIPDGWVYPALLELCNAGALLWIIWTGLIEMVGRHENSPLHHMHASLLHARDPL